MCIILVVIFMKTKLKAVILDGFTENPGDISWENIEKYVDLTVYPRTEEKDVVARAEDADILIVNKVALTRDIVKRLPKLKYVSTLATGYNQIDGDALKERGIPLSNIPSYSTNAVAQMVFAYILEFVNKVGDYTRDVQSGTWSKCEDFCYINTPLYELDGKTLGIIGYGKIGKRVSEIASAFGMKVAAYTPSGKKEAPENVTFTDMKTVIETSDYITVHCPLTESTAGLIDAEFISHTKENALIINTARGGVANENDIATALKNGTLKWYAADVLSTEPPQKDNPLLSAPNCFITPHIAWAAYETRLRLMGILEENISSYLNSKPVNVVNGCFSVKI